MQFTRKRTRMCFTATTSGKKKRAPSSLFNSIHNNVAGELRPCVGAVVAAFQLKYEKILGEKLSGILFTYRC